MDDFDCFVMYDVKTLEIKTISPCLIEPMGPEYKVHKIKLKDVEPFLKNLDSSHKYILDVSKEYARLVSNLWAMGNARTIAYAEMLSNKAKKADPENIVNDANYRSYFFEHFNIEVQQGENDIVLSFDLENCDQNINSRFCMSVTEDNGGTELYITKFRDPTVLYYKHTININDFKTNKEIRIPGYKNKVSVWASRTN